MMANEVEIIIKAIDKASGELKKVNSSMASLNDVTKSAGIAIGLFGAALSTTSALVIKTADGARDYILEMADLAIKTGTTANEMSRLVQIGDDLRVSQQSLELAFRNMSANGIQPTLRNIQKLSDKYLAITDPVERAQFAMENFGARSGQEMQKLLAVGGPALEEMSRQVDEFGLAVSETDRMTAQAYFNMQDSFSDMAEGLKKEAGTAVMPALIALMGGAMATKGAFDDFLAGDAYPPSLFRIAQAIAAAGAEWRNQQAAIAGNVTETGFLANATGGLIGVIGELPAVLKTAEDAFLDQTASTVEGYLKNLEYKAGVDDIAAAIAALRDKHVTVTIETVTDEVARQTWAWREELAKPDTECFVAGTLVAMADGTAMPIEDVRVGDGVQSYDEKAGIFVPSIVLAELPAVEDHINALRFSDGSTIHVTDRHHFLTNREWVPADELVEGDEMVGLSNGVRFLTRTRTVGAVEVFNLEIAITHIYIAGGLVVHNAKGKAAGADFVVPPGYPNDSYPMRVQSGEHVQVTPPGEKPSGNNVTINAYVADSISEDALLAALARIAH